MQQPPHLNRVDVFRSKHSFSVADESTSVVFFLDCGVSCLSPTEFYTHLGHPCLPFVMAKLHIE